MNYSELMQLGNKYLMREETYKQYLAEGGRFITKTCKRRFEEVGKMTSLPPQQVMKAITPMLIEELEKSASEKSSGAWRKLRRSLTVSYENFGLPVQAAQIKATRNPVDPAGRPKPPGRASRKKTVTKDELKKICDDRISVGDKKGAAILLICYEFGVRPCEVPCIRFMVDSEDGTITAIVTGAKKTARGEAGLEPQRGLDRELTVRYKKYLHQSLTIWSKLTMKDLKCAQSRIYRVGKKLWPRRKQRFCLYSLRYNKGSILKKKNGSSASGRARTAAVLGHHTTTAQSAYGHANASTGGTAPIANIDAVNSVRRIPLPKPPWQQKPPASPRPSV